MQIVRRGFPTIIKDNDEVYLSHLTGIIDTIDEYSSMDILFVSHAYQFRIAPSHPKYLEPLLQEILKFNNLYGIKLDLSKSIKTSSTISFNIELSENEKDKPKTRKKDFIKSPS